MLYNFAILCLCVNSFFFSPLFCFSSEFISSLLYQNCNYVILDLSYSLLFLKTFYIFLSLIYAKFWVISSHSPLPQFTISPSRSPLFHLTYPISLITFPKVIFSCSAIPSFLIAVTFYNLIFFFKYLHILELRYVNA